MTGTALGAWIVTQRYARRENAIKQTITEEQVRLLDEIGMNWGRPDGNKGAWEEYIRRIQEYKDGHGDCKVPKTYVDPRDGYPLGKLVSDIRSFKRKTGSRSIPKEYEKILVEMGFDWGKPMKKIMDDGWDTGIAALKSFLDSGKTQDDITAQLVWNEYNLGKWFYAVLSSYRGASSYAPLNAKRRRQLKALGIDLAVSRPRLTITLHDFSDPNAMSPEFNKPVLVYLPDSFPHWREGVRISNKQWIVGGKKVRKAEIAGWAEYPGEL